MPKSETPLRGLFKNGALYWLRIYNPQDPKPVQRSTGTADTRLANRILLMRDALYEERKTWDLIARVVDGSLKLSLLYNHHAAGTLDELRKLLAERKRQRDDTDLEPLIGPWARDFLAPRRCSAKQRQEYMRMVRVLVGESLPASQFTEATLKAKLLELPQAASTRRNYLVAWRLFYKYLRRQVPNLPNPFEYAEEWAPDAPSPRSTYWEHSTVRQVLDRMSGEARIAMTLIFGSGMELGAALAMTGADVGRVDAATRRCMVIAHGTKNSSRTDRTIFVDAWATPVVQEHARLLLPSAPLWRSLTGDSLRDAFYAAQVASGLVLEPPRSATTAAKLWGEVRGLHTIHDARHTFCVNRLLGLDGESRESIKYCSMQLGHADEQMVMRIYSKANLAERLRLIELADARAEGARAVK